MYGPASSGSGGASSAGPPRERRMTPRGQMSRNANERPPLADLPPNLKMMFQPRLPLPYKPPITKRPLPGYSGIAAFTSQFETTPPPPPEPFELPKDRKERQAKERTAAEAEKLELLAADYDPNRNVKATENAYTTLFVGRLSYDTTEKRLRREMETYGPIKSVRLVMDFNGKSRGYAFVEFEKEDAMTQAYRKADGMKIDDRRIVVDVERGRTVRGWRPRRLGGGLGGRKPKAKVSKIAPPISRPTSRPGMGYSRSPPKDTRGGEYSRYGPSSSSRYGSPPKRRYEDMNSRHDRRSRSPDRRVRRRSRSRSRGRR